MSAKVGAIMGSACRYGVKIEKNGVYEAEIAEYRQCRGEPIHPYPSPRFAAGSDEQDCVPELSGSAFAMPDSTTPLELGTATSSDAIG